MRVFFESKPLFVESMTLSFDNERLFLQCEPTEPALVRQISTTCVHGHESRPARSTSMTHTDTSRACDMSLTFS
jgi:hypothetical protein